MTTRGTLLFLLFLSAACQEPAPPAAAPTEHDPSIPRPAPVGPLVAPPAAGATAPEPRGLLGPTGTLGPEVYRARRQRLADAAGAAVLVINDMKWDGARDGMDFYWLTGIDEPGAALLLVPGAPRFKEVLFLERRDVEAERWDGERAPLPNKALEVATGIGRIQRKGGLPGALVGVCARYGALAFVGEFSSGEENAVLSAYRKAAGATLGCSIQDKHGMLGMMRATHDAAELALLRKAIDHTAAGHQAAIAAVRPGAREFEVKDAIEDAFRKAGSRHLAFDSITGSGPNAAVLHYPKDDRVMKEGELIVVDIGAEAESYAADVTRTLPVGGRYTPEQRQIYDIVLAAQAAGIDKARAGTTIEEIDLATRKVIEDAGYYDYYIHSCCHFVGLEVHDAGTYSAPLPAGAVITVEPGIYLPQRGFGVRIEDQVLVGDGPAEVLTAGIPKDANEIERLMAGKP